MEALWRTGAAVAYHRAMSQRRLAHHARKGDARRPCIARDQRRAFRLRRGAPWSKRPDVSGNARPCTLLRVSARVVGTAGRCTIRPDADPIQPRLDVRAFQMPRPACSASRCAALYFRFEYSGQSRSRPLRTSQSPRHHRPRTSPRYGRLVLSVGTRARFSRSLCARDRGPPARNC
jgi:hypothetical protein